MIFEAGWQTRYVEFDELFKESSVSELFTQLHYTNREFSHDSFKKKCYYIFSVIKFFIFYKKLILRN